MAFRMIMTEKGGGVSTTDFEQDEVTIGRIQGNDVLLAKAEVHLVQLTPHRFDQFGRRRLAVLGVVDHRLERVGRVAALEHVKWHGLSPFRVEGGKSETVGYACRRTRE